MPDEIETILRLVAEGHLGAEEAEPIIEALQRRDGRPGAAGSGRAADPTAGAAAGTAAAGGATGGTAGGAAGATGSRAGTRQLRIELVEHGRQVLNLRIPLGLASVAVDRVPGLSGQYRDSIREAVRAGMSGPIVDVGDDLDRVRVILE